MWIMRPIDPERDFYGNPIRRHCMSTRHRRCRSKNLPVEQVYHPSKRALRKIANNYKVGSRLNQTKGIFSKAVAKVMSVCTKVLHCIK